MLCFSSSFNINVCFEGCWCWIRVCSCKRDASEKRFFHLAYNINVPLQQHWGALLLIKNINKVLHSQCNAYLAVNVDLMSFMPQMMFSHAVMECQCFISLRMIRHQSPFVWCCNHPSLVWAAAGVTSTASTHVCWFSLWFLQTELLADTVKWTNHL